MTTSSGQICTCGIDGPRFLCVGKGSSHLFPFRKAVLAPLPQAAQEKVHLPVFLPTLGITIKPQRAFASVIDGNGISSLQREFVVWPWCRSLPTAGGSWFLPALLWDVQVKTQNFHLIPCYQVVLSSSSLGLIVYLLFHVLPELKIYGQNCGS